jgi:hypothetical protein
LGILGCAAFVLHTFFISTEPLFISPIGKANTDLIRVEKILKDNKILFSKVTLSDYSYLVDIQNNGQVRLSQDKDINKQIASLQRILIQLTIEGKSFKSIDFRFSEPIISF